MTEYEPKTKLENNSPAVAASTLKQQLINSANQVIPNTAGRTLRREFYETGIIPDATAEAAHPQIPTDPEDVPSCSCDKIIDEVLR
mgnify:CR=1 FL=1